MCEHHTFAFDEDRAYENLLVSVLETTPEHRLSAPEAPRQPGVYMLFRSRIPVYVGKAKDLRSRLNDQSKKIANRKGINVSAITCRFLTMEKRWEILRAEAALRQHYNPEWNGIPKFKMPLRGSGRPGMRGHVNEWDKRFPSKKK